MDEESVAVEIALLKREVKGIREREDGWAKFAKTLVIKAVSALLFIGTAGIVSGWQLPKSVRESLANWILK